MSVPELWVLLGPRRGDNLQMLALAEAVGLKYRAIQLTFNFLNRLPNQLIGASRWSTSRESLASIEPPWPAVIITSGRRAVPLALWIREQSRGRTRLVHIGRPWASLSRFDLIVTTPQYRLPPRPNVLCNLMPLIAPSRLAPEPPDPVLARQLAGLPRPWIALFTGGSSRPYVLDESAAAALARSASDAAAKAGGSLLVVPGPRTSIRALDALRSALHGSTRILEWSDARNPYRAIRHLADRFIVTCDSAVMPAELITTGRPVEIHDLPKRRDLRMKMAGWFDAAARANLALHWLRDRLIEWGVLTSIRDLDLCLDMLRRAGMFANGRRALDRQQRELRGAADAVRRLLPEAESAGSRLRPAMPETGTFRGAARLR